MINDLDTPAEYDVDRGLCCFRIRWVRRRATATATTTAPSSPSSPARPSAPINSTRDSSTTSSTKVRQLFTPGGYSIYYFNNAYRDPPWPDGDGDGLVDVDLWRDYPRRNRARPVDRRRRGMERLCPGPVAAGPRAHRQPRAALRHHGPHQHRRRERSPTSTSGCPGSVSRGMWATAGATCCGQLGTIRTPGVDEPRQVRPRDRPRRTEIYLGLDYLCAATPTSRSATATPRPPRSGPSSSTWTATATSTRFFSVSWITSVPRPNRRHARGRAASACPTATS